MLIFCQLSLTKRPPCCPPPPPPCFQGINPTSSAPVGGGLGEGSGGSGPSEGTPPTDNERVTGLLRAAGFDDVQAAEFLTTVGWGESFSDWATFKASFINTVINTHPDTAKATLVEDLVKEHLNRFKARAYADQLVTYVSSTFRRPDEEQRGVGSSWSSITNVRKTAHFYLTQTETGPVVNEAQKTRRQCRRRTRRGFWRKQASPGPRRNPQTTATTPTSSPG
jgi:hypothetical protein